MGDSVSYSEFNTFGPDQAATVALLAGQMPDGTLVYPPSQLFGQDMLGDIYPFWVERVTKGFSCITTDHALIHAGLAYTLSGFLTLTNGQTAGIAVSCPAGSYIHFKPVGIGATGSAKITLLETATFTGGTTLTPRNRNRRHADASITTCRSLVTPTITGTQTPIGHGLIPGGGAGASKIGGSTSSAEEHVLKDTKEYVVKIDNIAGATIEVMYDLFWYEEGGA